MTNYFRLFSFLGFLACAFGMGFALYLEHFENLEPCAMCVFQRVAMIATGVFFLLGALHGPKGTGQWVYAGLADLAAIAGAVIAGRHVWLQNLPEDQVPACGPALDYMLEAFPLLEVIEMILKGDGNCAVIDASFLGLSLPGWTLVAFIGLSLWASLMPILSRILARIQEDQAA